MIKNFRSWLIFAVGIALFPGCGDEESLPSGVVAKFRDHAITASALDHAMVGLTAFSRSAENAPPYWPNDVEGCIDTLTERPATRELSPDEIQRRCEERRNWQKVAALRLLIQGQWYAFEARRRGIESLVSRETLVSSSKHSGVAVAAIEGVASTRSLRALLLRDTLSKPPSFSRAKIARYFKDHSKRYGLAPQRIVDALVVPTRATAGRVAAAFRHRGSASANLLRKFKDDGAIRPYRGNLQSTTSSGRAVLQRAALALGRGGVGMVKDPRGWYVFRVAVTLPRTAPTLQSARAEVELDLRSEHARKVAEAYNDKLQAKYQGDTVCADGYDVLECE